MRHLLRSCLAALSLLVAGTSFATFHTFRIDEIYSNADGSVQFAVLIEGLGANGQEFWQGHALTAKSAGGDKTFVFPGNLPGANTARRRVLVATPGFVALGLVTPDYVIPNGFIPLSNGALNFAGVDELPYTALPTAGDNALYATGETKKNLATNFAGQSASVETQTPALALNYQGLWWNASESGWGINFAHQGDIIFATWFTYDAGGKPWWLIAELHKGDEGVYTGSVSTVTGPPFGTVPFPPYGTPGGAAETTVGTMTATFTDATHATLAYTVNGISQTKAIVPQEFGPLPTCVWGAQTDLGLAANFTDLWWNASESGWGINFTHQGNIIFATWYTYDALGRPWWLTAELHESASKVYAGSVTSLTGPPYNAMPFPPSGSPGGAVETDVGTATVTFANGNAATFDYTVNGIVQSKEISRQVFVQPGTVCQ